MNKKIYVGMTADIMHPGLIHIIHEATKYGDVIVGLLTDKAIAEHKRLPYLTYDQRKEVVENIKGVCEVVPQEDWSYVPNLEKLKPDYIIHGDDWKTGPLREVREQVFEVMDAQGGKVIEIPYTRGINSSSLDKDIKAIGTTPDVRLKSLRRLIQAKPVVRILEAHDGLCGLIIENLEVQKGDKREVFDGMWSSSLTDSTSKGKPDIEAVDLTTRLQDLNNSVAVNINKANYSHHVIQQTGVLNVNCLSVEAPFSVFERFGFQSGRTVDKFEGQKINRSGNGLVFLDKYINAFMSLKVEQYVDLGTHGMFICSVTEARVMSDQETMTYTYYQNNVKPKPQTEGKKGFVCKVCGYIYEGDELPEDIICPLCKHGAVDFEPIQ